MKHRRRAELPRVAGPAVVALAAELASLTGCIPAEVTLADGGAGDIHVREGRPGTVQPIVASAGTVRVLDAALDLGVQACGAGAGSRICVRGGVTAGGRSAQ